MRTQQLDLLPKPGRPFAPPTLDEVKLAATKMDLSDIEAEKFWYYYSANGWRTGRNPMKYWMMALAGWKLRADAGERSRSAPPPHIQIKSIEHVIANHPANRDSLRFNPKRTPEQIAELKALRAKREHLHRMIAAA